MKTLIIFDIDGTLLYSNSADSQIFAKAIRTKFGFDVQSLNWNDYPHVTDTTILSALFERAGRPQPSAQQVEAFKDYYVELLEIGRKENPAGFMEVPGAKTVIDKLIADDNFIVGIATGGFMKPAFVKLHHIGINTAPLIMSFADGHETREQIISSVLREVESRNEQVQKTVYLGDAVWDVKTTRNMGIPFIGVKPPSAKYNLIHDGARSVIVDYHDYDDFLREVREAEPPGMALSR